MQVVDDEHDRLVERAELRQQPLDDRLAVEVRASARALHEPVDRPRRAARRSTASQKRCASRSPRSTETHATRFARPVSAIHDRSRTACRSRPAPKSASHRPRRRPTAARRAPAAAPPRAGAGRTSRQRESRDSWPPRPPRWQRPFPEIPCTSRELRAGETNTGLRKGRALFTPSRPSGRQVYPHFRTHARPISRSKRRDAHRERGAARDGP